MDEDLNYDFKIGYTVKELRKKQSKRAILVEEMRKLHEACKTTRDRALILVAVNRVAPGEMISSPARGKSDSRRIQPSLRHRSE